MWHGKSNFVSIVPLFYISHFVSIALQKSFCFHYITKSFYFHCSAALKSNFVSIVSLYYKSFGFHCITKVILFRLFQWLLDLQKLNVRQLMTSCRTWSVALPTDTLVPRRWTRNQVALTLSLQFLLVSSLLMTEKHSLKDRRLYCFLYQSIKQNFILSFVNFIVDCLGTMEGMLVTVLNDCVMSFCKVKCLTFQSREE